MLVGQRRPRLQTRPRYSAPTPPFPKCPQRPNFVIPRAVAESMTPAPNPTIPEVPPAPQLRHSARSRGIHDPCPQPRHSRSTPSAPASSFRAQSRNPSPASQRISQRSQRPLHSTMDTATSRSMTALCRVTVCAEADDGVGRATASPSPNTPPLLRAHRAIPEVPLAPQLRHSARSRGIHDPCPQPRHSRSTPSAPTSSFRAQSRNPSPASQRISQRSQRPLHSTMDTATSRSMTALCRVTVCAEADDGVGKGNGVPVSKTRPRYSAPTAPFPKYPQRPNFVIPRAVAESMTPAPNPTIPEVPPAPQLRHSARSRGIHDPCPQPRHSRSTPSAPTSSFRAQSRNPSPASQRISQRSQRPLHSTMDTATSRSMTALVFRGQLRNPVPAKPKLRHSATAHGMSMYTLRGP